MTPPSRTRTLRRAAQSGAILASAGTLTALGWSALVTTDTVTGASPAPRAPAVAAPLDTSTLAKAPFRLAAARQSAVLVCQATGDGGYVLIRVLPERLEEYRRNPNNIVPAPAGGCPARVGASTPIPTSTTPPAEPPATTPTTTTPPRTTTTPRTTPTTTTPRTTTPTRTTPTTTSTTPRTTTPTRTTPKPAPARTATTSTTPAPAPSSGVSPATASGTSTPRSSTYTGRLPANLSRLPNTGNETALLLFFGVDLLLLGAGLRLRFRRSSF